MSLVIKKEPNDYFSFVVNGDVANKIVNTWNDLTGVGDYGHFKTSNGANLIKEQNIKYNEVTIIDGVTSLVPTSMNDLFDKLISVGYFAWKIGGGTGVINRFDELEDTFDYFGQDGKMVVVNESQLKLETKNVPNTSGLDALPFPLIPLKYLRVNASGNAYEFVDIDITPAGLPDNYKTAFDYTSDPQTFSLPVGSKPIFLTMNEIVYDSWSFSSPDLTISGYEPTIGETDKAIIYFQL